MTSTIFGYFDSREKAEAAANRLRRDFPDKNFSITVRQQSEDSQSTNTTNFSPISMTNINITKQAMNLGASMGNVTGQMMGMVVGSAINAPFMMMNMLMSPMTMNSGDMISSNMASENMNKGNMGNMNPGTMMSNMMNNMMGSMNPMASSNDQKQGDASSYTIKLETNDPLEEINHVLQEEGANQIKVYNENT